MNKTHGPGHGGTPGRPARETQGCNSVGDNVPCSKCGAALDTGLECTECGHDMAPEMLPSALCQWCGGKPICETKSQSDGCLQNVDEASAKSLMLMAPNDGYSHLLETTARYMRALDAIANGYSKPALLAKATLTGAIAIPVEQQGAEPVADGWRLVPEKLDFSPNGIRSVLIDRFDKAARGGVMFFDDIWRDILNAAPTKE